jgi:pilus assembly protein Flp/PilA
MESATQSNCLIPSEIGEGGEFKMMELFKSFRSREEGQALVEYALILSLVSVVAILALQAVGANVTNILNQIAAAL